MNDFICVKLKRKSLRKCSKKIQDILKGNWNYKSVCKKAYNFCKY